MVQHRLGSGADVSLAVVTLWRAGWSSAQQAVLDYITAEIFPDQTHFIWTVEPQDRSILEEAARGLSRRGYQIELVNVPGPSVDSTWARCEYVAALYTLAISSLSAERTLLIEDDEVAPLGTAYRLLQCWSQLPTDAIALMAAYRSRQFPNSICAKDLHGHYLSWPSHETKGICEASWIGGGFTLYQTSAMQACLPFVARVVEHGFQGWDNSLCNKLRARRNRLFVHCGLRVEHRCPEVLEYCRKLTGETQSSPITGSAE